MKPLIGIVNLSSNVSNEEVRLMTIAAQEQLKNHCEPAWARDHWFVVFYPDPSQISPRAFPMIIVDNDKTPGALGYHSEMSNGKIYGMIMTDPVLQNGGAVLANPNNPNAPTVSSVLSHEVMEMWADQNVNIWADGPEIEQGNCYAYELADSVESDQYSIMVGKQQVMVSNFVYPAWFDNFAAADSQFDYMQTCKAPFALSPGGYMVVRSAPGTEQQVFAAKAPDKWRLDMKDKNLVSRTKIRMPKAEVVKKKWWQWLF